MADKTSRQELIKFINFVTDRFFGQQVLNYMLSNAIDDYREQYYQQDRGDAFSEAREELRQAWKEVQDAS